MPFTAHDLRYHVEQSYPLLYAYLHRQAQRFLHSLKYDAFEVDLVVGHVVEQLLRLGILGACDTTALNALDHLPDAQFYGFLSRSVHNKSIDRLRKHRLQISTTAELAAPEGSENDDDPLNEAVTSLWGTTPFSSPEEIALLLASQQALCNLLKHCIAVLRSAPNQLQAVLQELQEMGADELLQSILAENPLALSALPANPHMSQHKDHAHKKLRHCLQQQSTNLTVMLALRLTKYGKRSADTGDYVTDIPTLAQDDLSQEDVRTALKILLADDLLSWDGGMQVQISALQMKRITRFYRQE